MIKKSKKAYLVRDEICEIIRSRRSNLLRAANIELTNLFWQIGFTINAAFDQQHTRKKPVIHNLSSELVRRYGRFFNEKDLNKMSLFARLYPDLEMLSQISFYADWSHFLRLLTIDNDRAREFHLNNKIINGLSLKELQKQMASKKRLNKNTTFKSKLPDFKLMTLNDAVSQNVFKLPALPSFRQLTEPVKPTGKTPKNKKTGVDELLMEDINNLIQNYRKKLNSNFNSQLNLLFWEVGKFINKTAGENDNIQGDLMKSRARQLTREFGTSFNLKQLKAMSKFAADFDNIGMASLMAHLVSWNHLLVLLALRDKYEVIFYTRLAGIEGLSVPALRKAIIDRRYDQLPATEKVDAALLNSIHNPVQKTITRRNRNAIFTTTTVEYYFEDIERGKLVNNTFKNAWFIRFITA